MGFNIANSRMQETAFIIGVMGAALAILATALRFVATRLAGRKANWEDWCAVLATFFYIAYVVPFLYMLVIMDGRPLTKQPLTDVVKMTKAGYVMSAQFCMQQMFAKLSLMFLYYRLFSVSRPFVISVYILGFMQVGWSIATYIVHWFECTPIKKLWNFRKVEGTCVKANIFLAAGETPNSFIDFALIGLAIWMVQSLRIKAAVKIKLSFLFALGGLAGVLGFVKIAEGFGPMSGKSPMNTETVILLSPIWAVVQQGCSVICCCAPIYKPLIPELGLLSKLRSFSTRTFSRKSSAKAHSKEAATSQTSVGNIWKKPDQWNQLNKIETPKSSFTRTSAGEAV